MERISNFASRIKEFRAERNLSFVELEAMTGVPAQTLNRYELGQRSPKLDVAVKIAEAIHVHPMWLQGYDVPANEKKSATDNDDGLSELADIFISLSPENRSKLLELSRLYLNAQHNTEEKK